MVAQREPPVIIGVIAMKRALTEGPLAALLARLNRESFPAEPVVLNVLPIPLEDWLLEEHYSWPIVECAFVWGIGSVLGAVEKVQKVLQWQGAAQLNSSAGLQLLEDRADLYGHCATHGIAVPPYVVWRPGGSIVDVGASIEISGETLSRPFLEKPLNVYDDLIYVYYDEESGGGRQLIAPFGRGAEGQGDLELDTPLRAFAQAASYPGRKGFLYDKFLPTGGVLLRVCVMGSWYCEGQAVHALHPERRICTPVYAPAMMRLSEKRLCVRAAELFGQPVCAVDLLRTPEETFVTMVHPGLLPCWQDDCSSFFEDAARLISRLVMARMRPSLLRLEAPLRPALEGRSDSSRLASCSVASAMYPEKAFVSRVGPAPHPSRLSSGSLATAMFPPVRQLSKLRVLRKEQPHGPSPVDMESGTSSASTLQGSPPKLRGVVLVARHADRLPKQKAKCKTSHPAVLAMLKPNQRKELKLKTEAELLRFVEVLSALTSQAPADDNLPSWEQMLAVLQGKRFRGVYRKVQLKPEKWDDGGAVVKATVVMKWGGVITPLGLSQAAQLGGQIKSAIYGGDVSRLHTSMLHDMKIFTSEEGRVQLTAAAFATRMLELEASLPIALVRETFVGTRHELLDQTEEDADNLTKGHEEALQRLLEGDVVLSLDLAHNLDLRSDASTTERCVAEMSFVCGGSAVPTSAAYFAAVRARLQGWLAALGCSLHEGPGTTRSVGPYTNPPGAAHGNMPVDVLAAVDALADRAAALEAYRRWEAMVEKCESMPGAEILQKLPAVQDMLHYDRVHNLLWLREIGAEPALHAAWEAVSPGADLLLTLKLGNDERVRAATGAKLSVPLLRRIRYDLRVASGLEVDGGGYRDWYCAPGGPEEPGRIRSRLHFTHRSHLSALLAVLEYISPRGDAGPPPQLSEVNYCSHIVLQVVQAESSGDREIVCWHSSGVGDEGIDVDEAKLLWRWPLIRFDKLLSCALDMAHQSPEVAAEALDRVARLLGGEQVNEAAAASDGQDGEDYVSSEDLDAPAAVAHGCLPGFQGEEVPGLDMGECEGDGVAGGSRACSIL